MGSGFYSVASASTRAVSYKMRSKEQNFKERSLDKEMDLRDAVREARDSEDHPNSFPIIIALDVTGSMGSIPQDLITNSLPKIMSKIMEEGVADPQLLFLGIGDHYYDEAPVQVGQFESSDELIEKWLMKTFIEGGGGPNDGESYFLAWYIAARHTSTDSFEKRGQKGVLITIGDEPTLKSITKADLKKFGFSEQGEVTAENILAEAKEKWEVYHINVMDHAGNRYHTKEEWKNLMKSAYGNTEHYIETQSSDGSDVPNIIAGIIAKEYSSTGTSKASQPESSTSPEVPEFEVNPYL